MAILKLSGGPPDKITPDGTQRADATILNNQAAGVLQRLLDGKVALESVEVKNARDKLTEATNIDPNYATPWSNRGLFSNAAGDYSGAEKEFTEALAREKNHEIALLGLADAVYHQGDRNAEAEHYYGEAIKEATGDATFVTASNNLGFLLVEQEKFQAALKVLNLAIERAPTVSTLYKNKALALFGTSNLVAAGAAAESALVRRNGFYPEADSILTRIREQSSN